MTQSRQALPAETRRRWWRLTRAFPLLLLPLAAPICSCGGEPDDLSRVAPPSDRQAYETALQSERTAREESYRTREDSPVPTPLRPQWAGLEYFPVDPEMRFEGPLIRKSTPNRFAMMSTTGEERPAQEVGYFLLDLPAGPTRLPVFELLDTPNHLFVPFMDATTGTETYGAGRYLDAEPTQRGWYRLDFNRAYNPSCAYGGRFSCPITPESNRLDIAIRVGEKGIGVRPP